MCPQNYPSNISPRLQYAINSLYWYWSNVRDTKLDTILCHNLSRDKL